VIILVILFLAARDQTIKGFRFHGPSVEQQVISMTADRLIAKKGLFSFGAPPEVIFENGYIDVYGFRPDTSKKTLKFGDIFSAQTFDSFPVKNAAGISAKPVTIRIHDGKLVPTQLFAANALFRIKERDMILSGDVRVLSEPYLLTTERLVFYPDTASFKIDKSYVLRTSDKRFEGNGLTTDIFLRTLNPEGK
jgi:hypothetical protein